MPKPLPTEIRTPLLKTLSDILRKAEVSSNRYLMAAPFEELWQVEQEFAKKKSWAHHAAFVGDRTFRDFFSEIISEDLMVNGEYKAEDGRKLLSRFDKYENPERAAENLIQTFESLPFSYELIIELPFRWSKPVTELSLNNRLEITDDLAIVFADDTHEIRFPEVKTNAPPGSYRSVGFFGAMSRVWTDSFVEEGNIAFNIRLLRKLLGDDTKKPRFIETVPKRGYRCHSRCTTSIERRYRTGRRRWFASRASEILFE